MNINQVNVSGNLVRDPEVKYVGNGTAVCQIGVAVNNRVKVKEEWKDEPCFLDVTVWGKTAEYVGEYLGKGDPVFISGRLKQDTWDDKETGQKRYKICIVAETLQSLRYKNKDDNGQKSTQGNTGSGQAKGDEIPF